MKLHEKDVLQIEAFISQRSYDSIRLFFDGQGRITHVDGTERMDKTTRLPTILAEEEYQEVLVKQRAGKIQHIERNVKKKLN